MVVPLLRCDPPHAKAGPPFSEWELQHAFEGGYTWLTPEGPALVSQSAVRVATTSVVDGFHDFVDMLVEAQFPSRLGPLIVLFDWRSIERVEPQAAARFLERAHREGRPFSGSRSYIATSRSPVVRMVIRAASMTFRTFAGNVSLSFVADPQCVLDERGIAAPPSGFLPEWLGGVASG